MSNWKSLEKDIIGWLSTFSSDDIEFRNSFQAIIGFPSNGQRSDGMLSNDNTLLAVEIEELAGEVETAGAQAKLTFAFFNNHWQAYAPRNAVDMKRALKLPFQEIRMPLREERDERDNTYK
ncbi:hypothetical protein ACFLVG_01200 [Chloroflexota bacterium]